MHSPCLFFPNLIIFRKPEKHTSIPPRHSTFGQIKTVIVDEAVVVATLKPLYEDKVLVASLEQSLREKDQFSHIPYLIPLPLSFSLQVYKFRNKFAPIFPNLQISNQICPNLALSGNNGYIHKRTKITHLQIQTEVTVRFQFNNFPQRQVSIAFLFLSNYLGICKVQQVISNCQYPN